MEMPVLEDSSAEQRTQNLKTNNRIGTQQPQDMSDESDTACDEPQNADKHNSSSSEGSSVSPSTSVDNFLGVGKNRNPKPNNFLGVGEGAGSSPGNVSFHNTGEDDSSGVDGFFVENVNNRPFSDDFPPVEDNSLPDPDHSTETELAQKDSDNIYSMGRDSSNLDSFVGTEENAYSDAENFIDPESERDTHPGTDNFLGVSVNGISRHVPDNFLQTETTKEKQKTAQSSDPSEPSVVVKIEIDVADSQFDTQPNTETNSHTGMSSPKKRQSCNEKNSAELLQGELAPMIQSDSNFDSSHSHPVTKDISKKEIHLQSREESENEQPVDHSAGSVRFEEIASWQIKVEPQSDDSLDSSSAMVGHSIHSDNFAVSSALISSFANKMLEDVAGDSSVTSSATESRIQAIPALTSPSLQQYVTEGLHIKQEPMDQSEASHFIHTDGQTTVSYDPTNFPVGASSELADFVIKMEPESDQDTIIEEVLDSKREDFASSTEEERSRTIQKKLTRTKPLKKKVSYAEKPRPHHCQYCDSSFTKLSRLKEHTRIHTDERPYKCEECNISFRKAESLKVHIRKHTGELPFRCDECECAFKCSQELKRHIIRKHTAIRPFSCTECDLRFWSQSDLRGHRRIHTGEKPYKCTECHSAFRKSSALTCHMRIHTGQKPYSCTECDRTFRRSDQLKRHVKLHSGEKPYECSQCDAAFTCTTDLKKHCARKHSLVKAFTCPECGNKFYTNEDMKMHRIFHMGIKPHSCAECGAAFVRPSDLKVHMRIHTGEKPFSCKVCSATFARSGDLRLHLRMHDDKRPFTCSICNLSFRRSGHLTRHMNTHNGHKSFCCEDCDAAFYTSSDLKRHASRVHKKDISKFGCTECEARFFTARALNIHMMKHTGERPFPCNLCGAAFSHSDLLDTHLTEIHGVEQQICKAEPESQMTSGQFMYIDVRMIADGPGAVLDGHASSVDVPPAQIVSESL